MILKFGAENDFKVCVVAASFVGGSLVLVEQNNEFTLAPLYVSAQIFFIESVCDDPNVIASNIMVSPADTETASPNPQS